MYSLNNIQQIFEPKLIEEIKECGVFNTYREGDIIVDYGKYIQYMPIVLKGNVKVYKRDEKGNEILLYYLSSSDSCSMAYSCCIASKKSEIRAIAEDQVELLSIPHSRLEDWLCNYTSWRNYIMLSFNNRFLELLKTVESIAFQKLDERLIAYLKEKQRVNGSSVIKASHNTIAEELSTSRVVISRLLKQLENEKKVLLYRNEVKILSAL